MARLEDLSDDILFLVLQYLELEHFSILQQLRLVSWRLKDFAESQIYKNVIVGDDENLTDATNRLVERFIDHTDTLSRHVQYFTVASFEGDSSSSCLDTGLFVKLMRRFQGLTSFSWNIGTPMPKDVLDAFHKYQPNARLCVKTHIFDSVLLSSPQLYRLDFSVACQNRFSLNTISLFRQLKNILVQSRNLRILSLNIHKDPYFHQLSLGEADRGNLNLPLEPGDRMPPLEELTIEAQDYAFDRDHYLQWLECMDWKRLRRLSFGLHRPGDSFAGLVGQTPNLQYLGFGYSGVMVSDWGGATVLESRETPSTESKSTGEFIGSIESLKELVVRCRTLDISQDLWREIAANHGRSLRRLCIRDWNAYVVNTISFDSLNQLPSQFPCLRHLDIDLTLAYRRGQFSWDPTYVVALSHLSSLRQLKISIQSNQNWDQHSLSNVYHDTPHRLLSDLWNIFFDHDPTSELVTLTLRFWRREEGGTRSRDNSNRERLKQTVYVGSQPDNELKIIVHRNSTKPDLHAVRLPNYDGQ